MWNHWTDVKKKIKGIAAEIAQPYSDDSASVHSQEGSMSRGGTCRPLQEESRGTLAQSGANDSFRDQGSSLSTSFSERDVAPPVRRAVPPDAAMTPPSRLVTSSGREQAAEGGHAASSPCTTAEKGSRESFMDNNMRLMTMGNGSKANYEQGEEYVAGLQQQLRQVTEAKQQIEQQVLAYQEEVSEAHKKTVEYYEKKIADLMEKIASEKALKDELIEARSRREREYEDRENEVQKLKQEVKKLSDEATTMNTTLHEMKTILSTREDQYVEALQEIESLKEMRDSLLGNDAGGSGGGRKVKPPTSFAPIAHVDGDRSIADRNVESAFATDNEGVMVTDLRQRIEKLEEERLLLLREKEQMTLFLQEERLLHRATAEEQEQILCQNKEQAERLTELIGRLEAERQKLKIINDKEGEEDTSAGIHGEEKGEKQEAEGVKAVSARVNEELEKASLALKEEIKVLRLELDAVKREREEAVCRMETKLHEKHVETMAYFMTEEKQKTNEMMEALQRELKDTHQQQTRESNEREAKLQEEVKELHQRLNETQSNTETLSSKLIAAEKRESELQSSLQEAQRAMEGHETALVSALTARKKELESGAARQKDLMQQLEQTITDCLVNADIDLPPREGAGASLSDKVTILATEFNHLFASNQNATRLQKEWERTYEQARGVNTTLSQQVNEAWKTIGNLREDLSVREQSLSKLKQQLQAESQQYRDVQRTLTNVSNELQLLKEEKKALETRMGVSNCDGLTQQEQLMALASEVETLRENLHDRDEELSQAHRSLETLQQVLDTFTQNKTRDVEERTTDMQVEIDQLRAQLLEAEKGQQHHQEEIDKLIANHRREMAAKSLEITSLHRKHAELRKALDETARQLNGSTMIDKRVISHITVNFIHAFVGHKREADEMLKVLSGLLNWDEEMQEKAGLLPGPTNPKPGQQGKRKGIIGGIVKTVWGGSDREKQKRGSGDGGGDSAVAPSIAELWVEFLMRESELGGGAHGNAVTVDTATMNTAATDALSHSVSQTDDATVVEEDGSSGVEVKSLYNKGR